MIVCKVCDLDVEITEHTPHGFKGICPNCGEIEVIE